VGFGSVVLFDFDASRGQEFSPSPVFSMLGITTGSMHHSNIKSPDSTYDSFEKFMLLY
jgi:hypothetical protein